ncbi:hypothetical protein Pan216_57180 [Planctomycetes bacterium Pan216]|uniref:Uncharacterized protein n=1 Tax=Kolteria novifilia TaxID=2527975 RepID=A0A518BCX1_9BACT|nr:hypothetical protein Pan216_57180 [Planctomycetes bacterium Pan216]
MMVALGPQARAQRSVHRSNQGASITEFEPIPVEELPGPPSFSPSGERYEATEAVDVVPDPVQSGPLGNSFPPQKIPDRNPVPHILPHSDQNPYRPPTPPSDAILTYPPAPGSPRVSLLPEDYVESDPNVVYQTNPEVLSTQMPSPRDGLTGNRTIALNPFPNLYQESGPLGVDQLPWYEKPAPETPVLLLTNMEFQTLMGFHRNATPNGVDSVFGWYNSMQVGFPVLREYKIGGQLGVVAEPTTFPSVLLGLTAGLFHRSVWPHESWSERRFWKRLSYGAVYDGLYDSEHRVFFGQVRSQVSFATSPSAELGLWFTTPVNTAHSPQNVGSFLPLRFETDRGYFFFYRHVYPISLDHTIFIGGTTDPPNFAYGTYLSYRISAQTNIVFSALGPTHGQAPWEIYGGLQFYLWPVPNYPELSGNPNNIYRPFLRVLDHVQFLINKTPIGQ